MNPALPSTPKPVRFINEQAGSLLAHKRRRFEDESQFIQFTPSLPELPPTPYQFTPQLGIDTLVDVSCDMQVEDVPALVQELPVDRAVHSNKMLQADSHAKRKEYVEREQEDKGTRDSYGRHLKAYELWWDGTHQPAILARDPSRDFIPAFPVTAAKVIMFLDYEASRPKRKRAARDDEYGTSDNVGKSSLKQAINALEWWRLNHQSDYEDDQDTQRPLRLDNRIRTFERATAHNEPNRVRKSQVLKAAGSSADTYTKVQLVQCSLWCLSDFSGPRQVFVGIRDRAMLLLSTAIAFRGDSSRNLLWSDLFSVTVPMDDISIGAELKALSVLADSAKHNQNGRTDEHGAFRHRCVELCPIGALAMLFFAYFHILNVDVPNFTPDFNVPGFGCYGKRDWYSLVVFSTKTPYDEMSYDNHRDRVNVMHAKNDVHITKVTHGGRPFAVKTAREHGATVDGAKALGGWSESGSFRPCYDRALPIDAMLGAAMFNGRKPESYFLSRGCLEPPAELVNQLFPWVEREIITLQARRNANERAEDIALWHFLHLLFWFRLVLLQDAAVLFSQNPNYAVFQFAPFNTPMFRMFATNSASHITQAETEARVAFGQLPDNLVHSLRGIVTGISIMQQHEHATNKAYQEKMHDQMHHVTELIANNAKSTRRRHRPKGQLLLPPPPSVTDSIQGSAGHAPLVVVPPLEGTAPGSHPPDNPSSESSPFAPPMASTDTMSVAATSPLFHNSPDLIYPMTLLPSIAPQIHFPDLPACGPEVTKDVLEWRVLAAKFPEDRLRRHQWSWISESKSWLPYYKYVTPLTKITDIWVEYSDGLDGHLSVRELNVTWGAKWRRNNQGQKTECGRRKKFVQLVEQLAAKQNWNTELALKFIRTQFEGKYTPRAFCDYLIKNGGMGFAAVLKASESFS